MITGDMIKPGAVVIDVGMNRVPSGPRCRQAVRRCRLRQRRAGGLGAITPVPGGVGPMTRAMLLVNTVEAADRAAGADQNR
jgi:methylenetetrahydrofolate dehydrogenase (NADP+)/methenyltetrahydrofolate cyclohydrolase